jgi:peptidoglycan-N-acetylglucosamine deacetylase
VARAPRGGGGRSWWWLLLLVLIGAGVVAARSMGRPPAESPRSREPTAVTSATAPLATSTAAPRAFQAVATPTPARATAAPGRTILPTRAPAATPRTPTLATTTPASDPSVPTSKQTPTPGVGAVEPASTRAAVEPSATPGGRATVEPLATPGGRATVEPTGTPGGRASSAAAGTVALTFDAGADRGYAEDILDLLQAEHVVAGFGMTGQWARANPDLVRRMAADGHLVFNHTLDHRSFTGVSDQLGGLSPARRRAELEDADAIIAPLIGHSTRPYYRLPYGDDDARVAADVQPAGYPQKIGWTIDSLGWRGTPSAEIVARCLRLAAPGAVYVFHVGRASQDAVALSQIIRGLRERGFGFRRVD